MDFIKDLRKCPYNENFYIGEVKLEDIIENCGMDMFGNYMLAVDGIEFVLDKVKYAMSDEQVWYFIPTIWHKCKGINKTLILMVDCK